MNNPVFAELENITSGEKYKLFGNTLVGLDPYISNDRLMQIWDERFRHLKVGSHLQRDLCEDVTDTKYDLNSPVIIGDGEKIEFFNKGLVPLASVRPIYLKNLIDAYKEHYYKLAIKGDEGASAISRAHFVFLKPDNVTAGYSITDLFSAFGTKINRKQLVPGYSTTICHGDILTLPTYITMQGKVVLGENFRFNEVEKLTKYRAILVGNPNNDAPWGSIENLLPIAKLLKQRGFDVKVLADGVEPKKVFNLIHDTDKHFGEGDYLFFLYAGHGSDKGELIFSEGEAVHKDTLYRKMDRVRARKLLMFECCFSGNFLENIPLRSGVGVVTRQNEKAFGGLLLEGLKKALENGENSSLEDLISGAYAGNPYFYESGIMPGMSANTPLNISRF